MKNNKAPYPDNITKEEIQALDEFGIEITKLLMNLKLQGIYQMI